MLDLFWSKSSTICRKLPTPSESTSDKSFISIALEHGVGSLRFLSNRELHDAPFRAQSILPALTLNFSGR
jgi:hypothetical protein